MSSLTGRRISREFMDDPHAERAELAPELQYLRTVNRRLRGIDAALWHFKRWSREWPGVGVIRILDVGTGSADIPLAIANWAKLRGHRVHITGIDLHPVTVQLAKEYIGSRGDIEIVQADALKLMDVFRSGEFDYAHAGLFLHHLTDLQVMTVLRIMDRLTRRGLIWNDLVRSWISKLGVRLLTPGPAVSAKTRHDAIVSVEAGFTRREAIDLAQRAGLGRIQYHRHMFHRFTLCCNKAIALRSE